MVFLNQSEIAYSLISSFNTDVTGSGFLTMALIFLFIVLIGILFRFSFDGIVILTLPFALMVMAYDSSFIPIGIVILIIGGVILGKNMFFGK